MVPKKLTEISVNNFLAKNHMITMITQARGVIYGRPVPLHAIIAEENINWPTVH